MEGLVYDGFHDVIELRVRGKLPADREKMLRKVDDAIQIWEQRPSELKIFR